MRAAHHAPLPHPGLEHILGARGPAAPEAVSRAEGPVRLDHQVGRHAGGRLERVDVLAPHALQHALVVQQLEEVVRRRRQILAGVQVLGECPERLRSAGRRAAYLWTVVEVVEGEDGLGDRQVERLQVVV